MMISGIKDCKPWLKKTMDESRVHGKAGHHVTFHVLKAGRFWALKRDTDGERVLSQRGLSVFSIHQGPKILIEGGGLPAQ